MHRTTGLGIILLLAGSLPGALAQTSYPMVTRVQPSAVQRGQTADVTISGTHNFAGASRLLFEGSGLTAEVVDVEGPPKPDAKGRARMNGSVRARLTVAADTTLGPRELRVVTPQGVSSVGIVVIVPDPVVAEADDKANDLLQGAQPLDLPVAVSGSVGKVEDVDWYAIPAKAGQRVTFSLWGNRLEDKIHDLQQHLDPILVLHDARGRELAADDNHDLADPMLSYRFTEAGTYLLQVRDTTYAGNPNWTYVLQATSGPYVTSAFPMAVNPGAKAELRASGLNFDRDQTIRLDVPGDAMAGPRSFPLPTAEGLSQPFPLVVTQLPLAREEGDTPADSEQAQTLALPSATSGRLGEANDVDGYRFVARKGTLYAFEVVARRAGAATDPVLRILNDKGQTLSEVDDTVGKDPRLEWTAPDEGSFLLQVSDLHSRGGDDFGYVILAEPARPDFVLTCDPDKLNVGPGARTPLFVKLERRGGFQEAVTLEWSGLPAGITVSPLTLPPKITQGVVVVSASADAIPGASITALAGKAEMPDGPLVRTAAPREEIYLPGGGRGLYRVAMMAAAVTSPSDITVEASPAEITLQPGGTTTIDVTIVRHGGFDKGVNLAVTLGHLGSVFASPLPPGVSVKEAGSKTLLGPKETAGKIVLEAKPDAAPCERVPIAVMGHVSIDFVVKTAYCSAPISLTVAPKVEAQAAR
jgi:hypothetical protein